MELPLDLRFSIEKMLDEIKIKELIKFSDDISQKYRNEKRDGKHLLTKEQEALAYAAVRMPATYGAVYMALKKTLECIDITINSLLDVGAGTGAGSWAVNSLIDLEKITCIERENVMISVGKALMKDSNDLVLNNAEWKSADLIKDELNEKADLVICSYMINELPESEKNNVIKKLLNCTNKILIIIEPGTPYGFNTIRLVRNIVNKNDIIAPCPKINECPLANDDWCHSVCRISRSKIHKLIKDVDVPYEDEKFSYISILKDNQHENKINRILRYPIVENGKITVDICSGNGKETIIIPKREKELFKKVKKLTCGDKF